MTSSSWRSRSVTSSCSSASSFSVSPIVRLSSWSASASAVSPLRRCSPTCFDKRVDAGSQAVALTRDVAESGVERGRPLQRVQHLGLVMAGKGGAYTLVVRADEADVDHAFEARPHGSRQAPYRYVGAIGTSQRLSGSGTWSGYRYQRPSVCGVELANSRSTSAVVNGCSS